MRDALLRYVPPRFAQAIVGLVVMVLLFGSERVASWIESMGLTVAARVFGLDMPVGP